MAKTTKLLLAAAAGLAIASGAAATVSVPEMVVLGQAQGRTLRVDGVPMPAGTTILGPSRVASGEHLAVIHLTNRQILKMARDSTILLESAGAGRVRVAVESGEVLFLRDGEVFRARKGAEFSLEPVPADEGVAADAGTAADREERRR